MKKIVLMFLAFVFVCTTAFAFIYEGKIMTKEEIKQLTDDALIQTFTEIMIEKRATQEFHRNTGFTPKEYENFKLLLGFIINLRREFVSRNIEVPPIEDWIK
ncbi:MAG: hypothetical protein HQL25_07295 [Candidatus Omnitrophica bacterium]|nr:hypothetical protein [Candidatus Omnitrophota bacterium]